MPDIMKVKCNGPETHVNKVDLDKVLAGEQVLKMHPSAGLRNSPSARLRDRYVLPCDSCLTGKVIITRAMIEAHRSR